MGSVVQGREIAARVWRGDLPHHRGIVSGLADVSLVRARLHALVHRAQVAGHALGPLATVDVLSAEPRSILEATEQALDAVLPAYFPSWTSLIAAVDGENRALLEILIVQSVAARQARWVVRELELADARLARDLAAPRGPVAQLAPLVESARRAYQEGRPEEAVQHLVHADAIERSPAVLLQLAVALWRAGRIAHALHTVRVCLLEDGDRFASAEALLSAARVESSLRRVADGRGVLGPEEEAGLSSIAGFSGDKKSWAPKIA